MNQHLEKIEAVCKKVIPEIMEPKFGCKILVHLPHSKLICKVIKEGDDGSIMLDYSSFWWTKEQLSYDKKFEILGRDILIDDIFRLFTHISIPDVDLTVGGNPLPGLGWLLIKSKKGKKETMAIWKLGVSLSDQFPETWEFIAGLLPNAK